jgi:hypothetical protein
MADHDGSKLKMSGIGRNQGKQISQRANFSPFQTCKFVMLPFSTKGQQRPKTPSHNSFQHVAIRQKKCDIT